MVCVPVCLDPCSCVVDVGWERQEGITSPGSGALQSTQEQEHTCQVHTNKHLHLINKHIILILLVTRLILLILAINGIYNNLVNG